MNGVLAIDDMKLLDNLDHSFNKKNENFMAADFFEDSHYHESLNIESSSIKGNLEPMKELKKLEIKVKKLESELDRVGDKVKQNQQEILNELMLDNLIEIELLTRGFQNGKLDMVSIKLDNLILFESDSYLDLLMPDDKITLFYGSIVPGEHQIDVSAKIAVSQPDKLPLNDPIYKMLNKNINIKVLQKEKKKWVIMIQQQKNDLNSIQAEIIESKI